VRRYKELGIEELWLPTVDHYEPSLSALEAAVKFIDKFKEKNQKVYVHCKANLHKAGCLMPSLVALDTRA
jgi:atypical dual specificity phosphatase